MDAYQRTADLIKVLSHPARLQILEVLVEEGEACVCHLEWRLGLRQAALSQHLARLRAADLVKDHRQGLNIFYGLASDVIDEMLATLKRSSLLLSKKETKHVLPVGDLLRPCPCPRCNPEK
jgi:ArsR family transcriptional regulator